ncbi:MAG: hypothetical protein P1P84_25025, partial [Deferrisomatales bacterium]|nr:hypothetical protein [Deferrisomatales bacterium]
MKVRPVWVLGVAALALAWICGPASADGFPVADQVQDDAAPSAAHNPADDEYLVVWEYSWSAADHDIHARRLSGDGSPLTNRLSVAVSGISESRPDVAHNPVSGEYLVVFEYAASASDHHIYARRVDAYGSLVGSVIAVAALTNFEARPRVAYNLDDDQYLVVWEHREGAGEFTQHDVRGQRVAADGSLVGFAFSVTSGPLDEAAPAVAYGPAAGRYLVVWQDKGAGTGEYDLRGRLLDRAGGPAGAVLDLSTWEYDQVAPDVAFDPGANRFLVVWEDHHWGYGADSDIYGRLVAGGGALVGGSFGISYNTANHRTAPVAAFLPSAGEFLVAWEYAYSPTDHDVYRRRVGSDGSLPDEERAVSASGAEERAVAVAADGSWAALVVWADEREFATHGSDVYGAVSAPWLLSGHVYSGFPGDVGTPLQGAGLELYCSADLAVPGTLRAVTASGADGAYALPAWDPCEYTNLIEADPAGFSSTGAASDGARVVDPNWLQYVGPLDGAIRTGNDFWDLYDPAPGGWAGFAPDAWVSATTVTCSVEVSDVGTGLDVSTAA